MIFSEGGKGLHWSESLTQLAYQLYKLAVNKYYEF